MAKIQKGWRIEESLLAQIESAKPVDKTESEWVSNLVTMGLESVTNPVTNPDTAPETGIEAAIAALTAQLAVKDEQIAALNRSLEAAQDTAKAAQTLHAMESEKSLPAAGETTEAKGFFARLFGK